LMRQNAGVLPVDAIVANLHACMHCMHVRAGPRWRKRSGKRVCMHAACLHGVCACMRCAQAPGCIWAHACTGRRHAAHCTATQAVAEAAARGAQHT
jgi:hypothetical protein